MNTKKKYHQIALDHETYQHLHQQRKPGQSFNDLIREKYELPPTQKYQRPNNQNTTEQNTTPPR